MGNSASGFGQLQRAGVQRLVTDKRGKRKKRVKASRIKESVYGVFKEQGQDQQTKKGKVRVYLVTIIEEGMGNSKDKNYYSKEALAKAPNLFNKAKSYCDHPDAISEKTLPERSMRELVGWYSNCFVDNNPKTNKTRLRGKLHIFPDAKWLSDKIDTILEEDTAKDLFGISINAIGKTRPAVMNGEQVNYVEAFQRVDSADVVTEPAARGRFEKVLESRGGVRSRLVERVTASGSKRMREAASLTTKQMKKLADEATAAYNSDSPDEMKAALYDVQKALYNVTSISGKGSGQVNEEQYSNINPSPGGRESMATKVKSREGGRLRRRKVKAASGKGPDNKNISEPSPDDIEPRLEEADVEDEEDRGDVGEFDDFGDSSKKKTNESGGRRGRRRMVARSEEADDDDLEEDEDFEEDESLEDEGLEDEGMEDEDEGMEDEDEDGAMPPSSGAAAPTGGGAPGSSRMITADDDDGDDDDDDDMDDSGVDDDLGESDELPARSRNRGSRGRRAMGRESGKKRRRGTREASFDGGLGKSGSKSLPKGGDPTRGYEDSDEDWGSEDKSTSGVGKSYKIKTSRFSRNRKARKIVAPVVKEANRRIEILTQKIHRLRESVGDKNEMIERYKGVIRFHNSKVEARRLLESAVEKEMLPEGYAVTLEPKLYGLSHDRQVREIRFHSRLLESTKEAIVGEGRLMESVEGVGVRGGAASGSRTAENENSDLVEAIAGDGIPMKSEDE